MERVIYERFFFIIMNKTNNNETPNKNPCERCSWSPGQCDYCPHCSAGRLTLNERMYGGM